MLVNNAENFQVARFRQKVAEMALLFAEYFSKVAGFRQNSAESMMEGAVIFHISREKSFCFSSSHTAEDFRIIR